jgi:translation initiation factor IF-2
MSKKRVYELAKDLGLENKELISRLEKIGIAVKSHSSTLEESDMERIRAELFVQEPKEIVEKRIKSTVIRRRAVRVPVEEVETKEESAETSEEIPAVEIERLAEAAAAEKAKLNLHDIQKETVPSPTPVRTSIYRDSRETLRKPKESSLGALRRKAAVPGGAAEARSRVTPPAAGELKGKREEIKDKHFVGRPAETMSQQGGKKAEKVEQQAIEALKREKIISADKHLSAEAKKHALETQQKPVVSHEKPLQAPPLPKELFRKTDLKIVKKGIDSLTIPPISGKTARPFEATEKPKKKGLKVPFEVIMSEEPAHKKGFLKKLIEKKSQPIDLEQREKLPKWREEKKIAPAKMKKTLITTPKAIKRRIRVDGAIGVGDLAKKMGIKASEVISKLIGLGLMLTINQPVDADTAALIASDFGYQVEAAQVEPDEILQRAEDSPEKMKTRAPVVTIMGHVDHGKTSLLDVIRRTNVIDGEAGGITQAIGAYSVNINGRDIVFLDTPGHEAFTAMRARGAQVTDIVVLVVAADDGVMGQTIEAINHAKVAGVPIIVAINKMDKPGADPGKIRQALTEYGLLSEQWGGDTIFCEVSAKKKTGVEELLEMIILQADIMELKADPDRLARGVIIEARLDRGRGPLATVLIQEGTLREGDAFVSKMEFGRVRALSNYQGKRIREAGPATPVEVVGFSGVPQVGTEFICVEDERKAKNIGQYWIRKGRERELSASSKITLEQLYQRMMEGAKELNVIVKADVQGSIEALVEALNKLSTDDIKLKIIHSSTGAITENDVMLASASDAVIIGFNVRPDARVAELAEKEGIEIKLYDIIYNVIADVKAAMEGLLEPLFTEVVQGRAEIREIFRVPKVGAIAGSFVLDGKITRSANLRLIRDGAVVYEGQIASLRRFKEDAKEVVAGFECGIGIEGFNDIKVTDVIETYVKEQIERKL